MRCGPLSKRYRRIVRVGPTWLKQSWWYKTGLRSRPGHTTYRGESTLMPHTGQRFRRHMMRP